MGMRLQRSGFATIKITHRSPVPCYDTDNHLGGQRGASGEAKGLAERACGILVEQNARHDEVFGTLLADDYCQVWYGGPGKTLYA